MLRDAGFYHGYIDEDIGPLTKAALVEWALSLPSEAGQVVDRIAGVNVIRKGMTIRFESGMQINADGSPTAYGPNGLGQDYLGNAGSPGNWWGIATDSVGEPYIQRSSDPAPGYYVSTTALTNAGHEKRDPSRYINSDVVNFIVIPLRVSWAKLGQKARVTYRGKTVDAIVADLGPPAKLGEGSIALAKALGIPSNAKRGGVSSGVLYEIETA